MTATAGAGGAADDASRPAGGAAHGGPVPEGAGEVLLAHVPSSVSAARHVLLADLASHGVRGRPADDAALVLSELVSNALKHAAPLPSGQVRAAWSLLNGAGVRVEVTDGGGGTRPTRQHPSASSLGGRGLGIVDRLAADWGVTAVSGGTTVWALVRC